MLDGDVTARVGLQIDVLHDRPDPAVAVLRFALDVAGEQGTLHAVQALQAAQGDLALWRVVDGRVGGRAIPVEIVAQFLDRVAGQVGALRAARGAAHA